MKTLIKFHGGFGVKIKWLSREKVLIYAAAIHRISGKVSRGVKE
jgi:hypothetical protein